jgi:hypothetical protein
MPTEPLHPVPTHRCVVLTWMDKRFNLLPVETILAQRGLDLTQPYTQETCEDGSDVYTQAIAPPEPAA